MRPAEIAAGLIAEFDAAGVALGVVEGRLRAWPSASITVEVRAVIEPYRGALLAAVAERDAGAAVAAHAAAGCETDLEQAGASATAAQAVLHETTSCAACLHRTRFGNCARPVEAHLTERFELVAHPAGGVGCVVFEPAARPVPDATRDAIARIARADGWSAADEAFALDVAARCPEAGDWLTLAELVEATAAATDAGRVAGDHHHEAPP